MTKYRRTGGQILVDQLKIQGVDHVFCVPGESYLAVLDALYDSDIQVTVCRQEGGAAMMADAYGKLTGKPGICFVTRGPGATNASAGVHIARQDSTPMILFVGQIDRGMREREAFQELDYRAVFGTMTKWATEIDDAHRIPEMVSRAFTVAVNGRPGPVVMALPEDMLVDVVETRDAPAHQVHEPEPSEQGIDAVTRLINVAKAPIVIAGGSRWDETASRALVDLAEAYALPIATTFRRQDLFPNMHPNYVGDLGVGVNPKLVEMVKKSDLIILLGDRLSEMASQSYTLLDIPVPQQALVHVHPDPLELGRVYQATIAINAGPGRFLSALLRKQKAHSQTRDRQWVTNANTDYRRWSDTPTEVPGTFNLGAALCLLRDAVPAETVIANGAGNYSSWLHRFWRHQSFGSQLAPTSGSMGYGVPAGVAASRLDPGRRVIIVAGDGCFLMHGQEFATAVQYSLPIVVIIVDNGMYGTIRMHQEREYPERVIGTSLTNPDFAAYARAFGGHGERVERTEEFMEAFNRAVASGKPAILHCIENPEALTPTKSLSAIRHEGQARHATAATH